MIEGQILLQVNGKDIQELSFEEIVFLIHNGECNFRVELLVILPYVLRHRSWKLKSKNIFYLVSMCQNDLIWVTIWRLFGMWVSHGLKGLQPFKLSVPAPFRKSFLTTYQVFGKIEYILKMKLKRYIFRGKQSELDSGSSVHRHPATRFEWVIWTELFTLIKLWIHQFTLNNEGWKWRSWC